MKKFTSIQARAPLAPAKYLGLAALFLGGALLEAHAAPSNSIARVWNERALAAIRVDTPHPPAQARNYFSFSVAMYDAWAAYDPLAVGYVYKGKHTAANIPAARSNAISYAVYRLMKERHAFSRTAATTLAADDALMTSLGYNINDQSRDTSTPTGVGNSVFDAVSLFFSNDGSRQTNGTPYPFANPPIAYPDAPQPPNGNGYVYINPPLATDRPGITDGFGNTVVDINHWQRLQVVNAVDQNGFPQGPIQNYLGAQWLGVRPFSLTRTDPTKPWIDPGPPPYFGGATHAQFVKEVVANITADSQLSPDDGVLIDISPGAHGNNSLNYAGNYGNGQFDIFDGVGYAVNPVTGQPYAPNMVKRGDYSRVLAEFWADGPNSETPPGHWNVLANYVADHPLLVKRIGGTGPIVDDLEWDVKMYFALNAAVHDAACAAWSAKRSYDGWRPMSAVRYLAGLGQSSDPLQASYNANGLPLITNQIELVTAASVASGRHAGLTPGKIALLAWPGPPSNPLSQYSGVRWIHGDSWSTYQRTNFVTPPFPGYISGHSTFSRSAAELLSGLTGSPYFPGGLGVYSNYSLGFELGPSAPLTLQWASYYDAADEAGISRIWGGIHPPIDNLAGRVIGSQVGKGVWTQAKRYFEGTADNHPSNSIARVWNERALAAIRADTPHPPAQARNYFSFSVCAYDAWAAYDPVAIGYVYRGKHTAANIQSARSNAISYAVYRMMKERHAYSRTAASTLAADDALMTSMGYDINDQSRNTSTPTGVGNSVFDAVSAWFINDGARQTNGVPYPFANPPIAYPDAPLAQGGYTYINPPLAVGLPGITDGFGNTVVDINHWQRLQIVNSVDQNGFPQGPIQNYLGAQWNDVRPFALVRANPTRPWIDPGPPPFFAGPTHAQFVREAVAVITAGGHLTPDDGVMMDISPATYGNNSLNYAGDYGTGNFNLYDGHGYTNNPITGVAYTPHMVKRGDLARVLAEFWADGPNSETPPGHWNVLANYLADHPLLVKRIGGTGPVVNDLEYDVKMHFALNAAVHDAAVACWSAKRDNDGWRPIGVIRFLAGLGQSTSTGLPSYNPYGLPLITNQIELVTASSVASGRHAGLTPGKIALLSWPGPPADPNTQHGGVRWIHGDTWIPYQRTNFVTPAFPGYFSGHSTFSRSAADLLTALTGSPYFPGGLGVYSNYVLGFEQGPSSPMTLQWATYFDAADQAGISRIWGGIHPPIDNLIGRQVGAQVGQGAWALARTYWDGSVTNRPAALVTRRLNATQQEMRLYCLPGFYYKMQSTPNLNVPFTDEPGGYSQALYSPFITTNSFAGTNKFYRAASVLTP